MSDGYQFLTVWRIRAPLPAVWDTLRATTNWPSWWSGVVNVQRLEEGDEDGVGQLDRYVWKSKLPYTLAFDMRTTRVVHHRLIEGTAQGELSGRGWWEFSEADGLTTVAYHWHVQTTRLWMNLLAPALRPLFVWNHDWVMGSGGTGLANVLQAELVASYSGDDCEDPGQFSPPGLEDPMRHIGYVNYAVPPERIQRYLPPGFEVRRLADEQGREWGFVSIVLFENHRVRVPPMGGLPRPRMTFLQSNYRAYVSYQGQPCVWFFSIQVGTLMAGFDRMFFGVPTDWARLNLVSDWDAATGTYRSYRFTSDSLGRRLTLAIDGSDGSLEPGSCFTRAAQMVDFFCQPLVGYYREPDSGWISRMIVEHEPLQPRPGRLVEARSDILASFGLVYPDELTRAHSVLLHPRARFKGYLPDRGVVL
jgi:uncharacterized protein YqjF (DUF2071 family)